MKDFYKNKSLYHWLWVFAAIWIAGLLLVRLFIPLHGHRSWWNAIFHHKAVQSQLVSPVARTDDNDARVALINFYQKYTSTTDSDQRTALVAKNGDPIFIKHYKNTSGTDPVTCTTDKVASVQIENRILFNNNYVYSVIEYLQDDTQNYITTTMINSDGVYKVGNVSCGQSV